MTNEGYLTTADVLAYLRTTPRTLYRHLAAGEIPGVRVGHQWRFRRSDLDRWVERQSGSTQPAETATAPTATPARSRRRILVVDDETSMCQLLESILAVTDCDVQTASDALVALDLLRAGSYDLVLTDLRMPVMDGIELAREAKRLRPSIRVVIISGHPTLSSAITAVNIGVDGYLTKPFNPMDVLMTTARALNLGAAVDPRNCDQ